MRTVLHVLFASTLSLATFMAPALHGAPIGCEQLDGSFKHLTDYIIPTGVMSFKESKDAHSVSGFIPDSHVTVSGALNTEIFDCAKRISVKTVATQFAATLKKQGFDIVFNCEASACGKKDGYRLYFSTVLNDLKDTQHYIVGYRDNNYRALYAAEIDGQVRGFSLETRNPSEPLAVQNLIPFAVNDAKLSEEAKARIDEWIKRSLPPGKVLSISAYADLTGTIEKNKWLTEQRAAAVKEYVMEKHGVQEEKIVSIATANLSRTRSGKQGRFVELLAHNPS